MPSAVPVNSIIVYSCPADEVFEHNTYGEPRWLIRCEDNGKWTTREFWPKCVNPSEFISANVYRNFARSMDTYCATHPPKISNKKK